MLREPWTKTDNCRSRLSQGFFIVRYVLFFTLCCQKTYYSLHSVCRLGAFSISSCQNQTLTSSGKHQYHIILPYTDVQRSSATEQKLEETLLDGCRGKTRSNFSNLQWIFLTLSFQFNYYESGHHWFITKCNYYLHQISVQSDIYSQNLGQVIRYKNVCLVYTLPGKFIPSAESHAH